MSDFWFVFWILGTLYGFFYPVVVGLVLVGCLVSGRTFRPRPMQWLPLWMPGITYYGLEYLVAARQGWNTPNAVVALSAFTSLAVVASRVARRTAWLPIGAALGTLLACLLWWLIPFQGWDRMF